MIRLSLLSVLLFTGCAALGPGLHMDEEEFRERNDGKAAAEGEAADDAYRIVPITAEVLKKQHASFQKSSPVVDPLADVAANYEYKVSPHDVLSVIVWDHPELTIPAGEFRSAEATGHPVSATGTMFYPHVGVIQVGGLTLEQVRQILTERLAKVITRPQLDVRVAGFRGKRVHVTGEVVAPATFPVTDVPMRAQDAISQARGMTPEADLRNVTLTRAGKTYALDLQALYEAGDTSQNWLLQDGDVLNVPDRSRNKVFVLGEVRKPSSRLMVKGRMTLADAIGDTEGFDPLTSNPGKIYVIRGSFEKPTIYKLDASSPDALLLAVQFQLKPADVIYVSAYNLTRWNRIIIQLAPTIRALWEVSDLANRAGGVISP